MLVICRLYDIKCISSSYIQLYDLAMASHGNQLGRRLFYSMLSDGETGEDVFP